MEYKLETDICKLDFSAMKAVTDKNLIYFLIAKGFKITVTISDFIKSRNLVYFEKSDALDKAITIFFEEPEKVNNILNYSIARKTKVYRNNIFAS